MTAIKKISTIIAFFLFILFTTHLLHLNAEDADFPQWVRELQLDIVKFVQTEVNLSAINEPDRLEENEYYVFSLKGYGSLEKVRDPFTIMHEFFLSDGWKKNMQYQADGHGSSSFAYEKESHFCLISVQIDSSCDDEEIGHVPSKFWFEIYCREKDAK